MFTTAGPVALAVIPVNRRMFALPLPTEWTLAPPEHVAQDATAAVPPRTLVVDSASNVVTAPSVPVTLSSTESLAGTLALKLVVTLPIVVALHRFRTLADEPARPRSAHRTVMVAAAEVRLSSSTARRPEPDSTLLYTWRPALSSATFTPWRPRGSWSTAITSAFLRIAAVVELIVAMLLPARSGAPEIAHRLSSVRPCAAESPGMPTVSMSGSLTYPVCCELGCCAWSKLDSAGGSVA